MIAFAAGVAAQVAAQGMPIDAKPLPLAAKRLPASADECAVWRREQSFARSVERHDVAAFESFLHAGTVFDVATPGAERGREAVLKSWTGIVEGKAIALRWRPGIVTIGGEPTIAVSRGPYILQTMKDGVAGLARRHVPVGLGARSEGRGLAHPLRRQRDHRAERRRSRRGRSLGRGSADVGLRAELNRRCAATRRSRPR